MRTKGIQTMKIAVTYDNGEVFQHFGKTENFKVYEVEDNKIISSEVISSNGSGHGALAGVLADQGVNVLICGGLGGGAQTALAEAGIEVCAGAAGDTDKAVQDYLDGTLEDAGVTCDHHHEEGHSCGDHEEGHSCGGDCGGGCHGCGQRHPGHGDHAPAGYGHGGGGLRPGRCGGAERKNIKGLSARRTRFPGPALLAKCIKHK